MNNFPKEGDNWEVCTELYLQDKISLWVCVREKKSLKLEVWKCRQFRLKVLQSKAKVLIDCCEDNCSFIDVLFDLVNLSCGMESEQEYLTQVSYSQIWYSWICVVPRWYFSSKEFHLSTSTSWLEIPQTEEFFFLISKKNSLRKKITYCQLPTPGFSRNQTVKIILIPLSECELKCFITMEQHAYTT